MAYRAIFSIEYLSYLHNRISLRLGMFFESPFSVDHYFKTVEISNVLIIISGLICPNS